MRPDTARHAQYERSALQPHGKCTLGNPGAHGVAPKLEWQGRTNARETALPRSQKDRIDLLRRGELLARPSTH
jgi:hypothetical protein